MFRVNCDFIDGKLVAPANGITSQSIPCAFYHVEKTEFTKDHFGIHNYLQRLDQFVNFLQTYGINALQNAHEGFQVFIDYSFKLGQCDVAEQKLKPLILNNHMILSRLSSGFVTTPVVTFLWNIGFHDLMLDKLVICNLHPLKIDNFLINASTEGKFKLFKLSFESMSTNGMLLMDKICRYTEEGVIKPMIRDLLRQSELSFDSSFRFLFKQDLKNECNLQEMSNILKAINDVLDEGIKNSIKRSSGVKAKSESRNNLISNLDEIMKGKSYEVQSFFDCMVAGIIFY